MGVLRNESHDPGDAGQQGLRVLPKPLNRDKRSGLQLDRDQRDCGAYGMQVGLWWFLIGFGLIIVYHVCAHRVFWGKIQV